MTQRIGDKLIEHDQREARLFADRDLDQGLLLLALAISRALREGHMALEQVRIMSVEEHALAAASAELAEDALRRAMRMRRLTLAQLRGLIQSDIPRYDPAEPFASYAGQCMAPTKRATCGRRTSHKEPVRSRDDGTVTWRFYCTSHSEWARELRRANPSAADCPTPPCNTGGLLMRHFPDWDWLTLYRWAYGRRWEAWQPPADVFPDLAGMWGGIFGVAE